MVAIQIFGQILRAAVEESEFDVSITAPTTVKQLIGAFPDQLGPLEQYVRNRETMITVNKRIGSEDSLVRDGDVVKFAYQSRASYDGTRDIPT